MEDKLLTYISENVDSETINNVSDKLLQLKNESNNFNDIIKENEIILNYKVVKVFYDFLYAFNEIYTLLDLDSFSEEISEIASENEIIFWKNILETFEMFKFTKSQTLFLKEMNFDDFRDLVQYTYEHYILYNSIIKEYREWDKEKIKIVEKTINTFLHYMINNFNDLETASYELDLKFQFSREKNIFVWELCEKNKSFLMMKQITGLLYKR